MSQAQRLTGQRTSRRPRVLKAFKALWSCIMAGLGSPKVRLSTGSVPAPRAALRVFPSSFQATLEQVRFPPPRWDGCCPRVSAFDVASSFLLMSRYASFVNCVRVRVSGAAPYGSRALRETKMPAAFTQFARMIDTNRSFSSLVGMILACLLTIAILFQTENVVFPSQGSLVPAIPSDIFAAVSGKEDVSDDATCTSTRPFSVLSPGPLFPLRQPSLPPLSHRAAQLSRALRRFDGLRRPCASVPTRHMETG